MKYFLSFALIFTSFIAFGQVHSESTVAWDLSSEKPGLKVYTRTPENGTIKELRILADFEGQIDTLLTILNDAENYTTWVYKCLSLIHI